MTKEYDRKHRYRRPPQGEIAHALRFAEIAFRPDPPAPDPEELRPPRPRPRYRDVYQCVNCSRRFTSLAGYRGHRDVDHGGRYEVPRLMPPLPVHHSDCGAGPGCGASCNCWCHEKASAA